MKVSLPRCLPLLAILACLGASRAQALTVAEAVQAIRSVGAEGRGHAGASAAVAELGRAEAREVFTILAGMDGANPLALNWLRSAIETIAAREATAGRSLAPGDLEQFIGDTKHHPQARRFAYELLVQADPARAEKLIAGLLDDPSTELRRDAVQRLIDDGMRSRGAQQIPAAIERFQKALGHARDIDQIEGLTKALTELGRPADLQAVFGWLKNWHVIGPFDNTAGAGYERVFPPEERIDLAAEYDGKTGKVRWQPLVSTNDYGKIDLNKPCGALKEVTGYAVTEIHSAAARDVELRLGCKNGWKLWLNGELLFGRDEYHRNTEIDHFRFPVKLKPGRNVILVKVTQNELKEEWTVEWEFQLRITDDLGTPIQFAKN